MRFWGTTGNIIYMILGIASAVFGLLALLGGLLSQPQDGSAILAGAFLLLIGGARIAWSIARMRAMSQMQARMNQRQMYSGYPPYPQQPGIPPYPQQGMYPPAQYPPYTPQSGAYPPPYGAPGQQLGVPQGAYPPVQYPPSPESYQPPYPPQSGRQ
ncbi:MAG TPA: hypothetical protein VKQ36_15230 [Ktedonobacterales bacterium]|nr:hypothetical protein [Ktedonobacterales bacterium]